MVDTGSRHKPFLQLRNPRSKIFTYIRVKTPPPTFRVYSITFTDIFGVKFMFLNITENSFVEKGREKNPEKVLV